MINRKAFLYPEASYEKGLAGASSHDIMTLIYLHFVDNFSKFLN